MKKAYKIINKEISNNFLYNGVDYTYDGSECNSNSCGCRDGSDYCRQNEMVNLRVESINLDSVRKVFLEIQKSKKQDLVTGDDDFLDYCVDRILTIYQVYDEDSWSLLTGRGYYGEEVNGVELSSFSEIVKDIKNLIKLSPNKRIEFVLEKEYGHLLDSIKDKNWIESEINVSDVIFNQGYFKKLKPESYYQNIELPLGVYLKQGEKYRLIDGFHRFISNKDKKIIKVIYGE